MMRIAFKKELSGSNGKMTLNVDCDIPKGKIVAIYGDSGAGKTSMLRIMAGLLKPDYGKVVINNISWNDTEKGISLPPQKRNVGYVFQDYALFPNMTILQNLKYALKRGENESDIMELINATELEELKDRKPDSLSGGQKQRVALARALIRKPELLLLDEPLSALNHEMRLKLQDLILKMHRDYNLTTIIVSHDISEIIRLADVVYMLEKGNIVKNGTPLDLFSEKKVSGKFQFVGEIISIEKEDIIYVVSVLIGNNVVKVVADQSEAETFDLGDKVLVASKAFNPMIEKIKFIS